VSRYFPERGDIAWLDFGPPIGHEQAYRRPALVLSPQRYNRATSLVLVCPVSTRIKQHPFEVLLPEALTTRGAVLSDQIGSVDWRVRKIDFIERAPERLLDEVIARIAALLEL
jgi:mRNA interferase MazF